MFHTIQLQSSRRDQFIDITSQVREFVREQGVGEGAVLVYCPHTTAGVTINENADPDVVHDMIGALDRMIPWNGPYRHGEGNSAAHLKASLVGASVTVPIRQGRLVLGAWQGIYFTEWDGPRQRKCHFQILSSGKNV